MEQITMPTLLIVERLRHRFRHRVGEWLTAYVLVGWGYMLASRPDMFSAPFYAGLAWAPQSLWLATSTLIGLARLAALLINGAWRYSAHVRSLLAAVSVFFWGGLFEGIWAFHQPTLGAVIVPGLLAADFYAAWRASQDARSYRADRKAPSSVGKV